MTNPASLIDRAKVAYLRSGGTEQPSRDSSVEEVNGKSFVRLVNINGLLAVYSITEDGHLRRAESWPEELNDFGVRFIEA